MPVRVGNGMSVSTVMTRLVFFMIVRAAVLVGAVCISISLYKTFGMCGPRMADVPFLGNRSSPTSVKKET